MIRLYLNKINILQWWIYYAYFLPLLFCNIFILSILFEIHVITWIRIFVKIYLQIYLYFLITTKISSIQYPSCFYLILFLWYLDILCCLELYVLLWLLSPFIDKMEWHKEALSFFLWPRLNKLLIEQCFKVLRQSLCVVNNSVYNINSIVFSEVGAGFVVFNQVGAVLQYFS